MPMTAVFTTVDGMMLHETRGGVESFYVPDPLGSLIQTKNTSGTVTYEATYWPYGEVRTGGVSSVTPFGFCGAWGYYTDATGRLYVRARYYRSSLTRWQTVDPLWPNECAYAYVGGRAVFRTDPSGKGDCNVYLCFNSPGGWLHSFICATLPSGTVCSGGMYHTGPGDLYGVYPPEPDWGGWPKCVLLSNSCCSANVMCGCIASIIRGGVPDFILGGFCWGFSIKVLGCHALAAQFCDSGSPPRGCRLQWY
jgi:RHS repeat-associated protein